MNVDEFRNLLKQTLLQHGFPLTDSQVDLFITYWIELRRWNSRINLTSIRSDQEIILKHFLDSLSVLHYFPIKSGDLVIDVGTGAGFPGIPIKICIPDVRLVLAESSLKKVSFLHFLIAQFRQRLQAWANVCIIAQRAEECARESQHINAYDWVLTRYVASLGDSMAYCLPLLKPEGAWIAYKSCNVASEIQGVNAKLQSLGGSIQSIVNSNIAELNRTYVAIQRIKELH